jgi:hypothetical protein
MSQGILALEIPFRLIFKDSGPRASYRNVIKEFDLRILFHHVIQGSGPRIVLSRHQGLWPQRIFSVASPKTLALEAYLLTSPRALALEGFSCTLSKDSDPIKIVCHVVKDYGAACLFAPSSGILAIEMFVVTPSRILALEVFCHASKDSGTEGICVTSPRILALHIFLSRPQGFWP